MESTAPKKRHLGRKILLWTSAVIVLGLAAFVYFRFYFVFGEGVKSGQLNFIVYKGYVFKTYEGRMIQVGYRSTQGTIQSNEFEFSVADPEVAKKLELMSGQVLDLHYKEYFGALPWRGMSKFIVDSIVGVRPAAPAGTQAPPVDFPNTGQ